MLTGPHGAPIPRRGCAGPFPLGRG